jgi:hypothetical protein
MNKVRTAVTLQSIQKLVDEIANRFHPQKVILFGSYAYRKPTENSLEDGSA